MGKEVKRRAEQYVMAESQHRRKANGEAYSEAEKDAAQRAYIRGWEDCARQAELIAVYSENDIINRLEQLRK